MKKISSYNDVLVEQWINFDILDHFIHCCEREIYSKKIFLDLEFKSVKAYWLYKSYNKPMPAYEGIRRFINNYHTKVLVLFKIEHPFLKRNLSFPTIKIFPFLKFLWLPHLFTGVVSYLIQTSLILLPQEAVLI